MPLKPDPTFYPSPASAAEAPGREAGLRRHAQHGHERRPARPTRSRSSTSTPSPRRYGTAIGRLDMPNVGDELHHFGWNACSSALCPWAPHPHVERRYLLVPGLRSSRIHVVDIKDDPVNPKLVKVIEPDELHHRTGYSRPHTVHCGPDGIYVSALGTPDGDGPGGVLLLDHDDFSPLGRWEIDRGPQHLAYDFWWNIGYDTLLTSEWGTPNMVEDGINPELLLSNQYGHHLHVWDLRRRRHKQAIDLGAEHQMVLELRPAHDPIEALRLRRRRRLDDGPLRVGLAVAPPGRRQRRRREGHHDPARARRARPAAADALKPFGAVPAAGHRHRPEHRRPAALRLLLGHRRAQALRRLRPRATRRRPAACASAGSSATRRTRPRAPSTAARRWSRSAATASAST